MLMGRRKRLIAAESGVHAALKRLGHTAIVIDDRKLRQRVGRRNANRWIRWRVRGFRPDFVMFFKNHDVDVEVMREIASRTATRMWYRDLTVPPDPAMVERAREVDVAFLTAGGQADWWQQQGVKRALWLPNAADRDTDRPVAADPRFACDVAFMGRGISPGTDYSRSEFLVRLSKRFHVRVWGQEWDRWAEPLNWDGSAAYGDDFARVCASAKIVIDIQPALWVRSNYDELYSSNRMVKTMACGGFALSQGAPPLQQLFKDGEHCAWYQTEQEAEAQIEKYLADDPARNWVREHGQAFVHRYHMLDNRVHNLLTGEAFVNPGGPAFTVRQLPK
ncbi:MAG: glycosyltransferase family protein [Gemmatimonadota bacterium]